MLNHITIASVCFCLSFHNHFPFIPHPLSIVKVYYCCDVSPQWNIRNITKVPYSIVSPVCASLFPDVVWVYFPYLLSFPLFYCDMFPLAIAVAIVDLLCYSFIHFCESGVMYHMPLKFSSSTACFYVHLLLLKPNPLLMSSLLYEWRYFPHVCYFLILHCFVCSLYFLLFCCPLHCFILFDRESLLMPLLLLLSMLIHHSSRCSSDL